jgi:hypothetical protein
VYADAENTSYSLMRFDGIVGNGTLQVPAGSTVQSATLSYEIVDLGDDANLHEMASSWSESVTWDQFQSFSYLPNPIAIAPGGVFQASCDVTQSVQAYVDGSPNYGWVFVSTGNDSVTTYSRERNIQSWRPSLVVTFVAPSDCNGNGIDDQTDIANGTSTDCNANFIPDECEIASNPGLDWNGDGTLDECSSPNYCTANPNSTGQIAVMSALGSPIITDNNFTLTASQMPTFEWGYFLMAASQGFIPNVGGSGGNLCLGFPFYRFSKFPTGQIISSGAGGTFSFSPNLLNLPQGVVFMIGETWDFQAWYRDGAASTSNFTDGIEVMFR